ncbi:MAG TPA: adenylate/guanylate cyclase domain-containing protein [Gaiellaceae bacterium]|nr:adenylate/guanylate cyclase domain-containing protein [Gaiellaceae bacterium]
MPDQPVGTVTLVFTDIEGSTRLLHKLGQDAYREALAEHRRIVREAFAAHSGYEVDYEGDSFFFAFRSASDALAAVEETLRELESGPIRIRVGIHTGEPGLDPPKYVGLDVHRAARIMSAGHGGQVLLSATTRELLDREVSDLGEHRLKDFAEPVRLFQLGSERFPALKTLSSTNLPRPTSSFVGRTEEASAVVALLREGARLLTLTGPGGSGKTRLAIEAAGELIPEFRNGVTWVGLSALREPALVIETIGQTLGAKDSVADHVGDGELLLLLDNFEQVIEASPELGQLLEACPNLKILVTSRELLRIRSEVEYPVPPLENAEAVELFCERSRLDADETIAELCRRLDDLPLALELAAARTSVLSPAQILERLSQRLDLLKGGRDAETRQQTLRATIEWSHDLLSGMEQALFRRLAVFRGGSTLEAAEEVAGADVDVLQSLVDKSLLRHGDERFWMLETIREFARERLAASREEPEFRRRHALFFIGFAEAAAVKLDRGRGPAVEFTRFGLEHDNLRAALEWARDCGEDETLLRLAAALKSYWTMRGFYEDMDTWFPLALERGSSPAPARMAVLSGAWLQAFEKKDSRAAALVAEWRNLAEQEGDELELLRAMGAAAAQRLEEGDFDGARAQYMATVERARALGDRAMEATATLNVGYGCWRAGDFQAGLDHAREALSLYRDQGDAFGVACALGNCGWNSLGLADPASAARDFRESLAILTLIEATGTYREVIALSGLGAALVALQEAERGTQLLAAAARLRQETGAGFDDENEKQTLEHAAAAAKEVLGEDAVAAAWARGEALTPEEIAVFAEAPKT